MIAVLSSSFVRRRCVLGPILAAIGAAICLAACAGKAIDPAEIPARPSVEEKLPAFGTALERADEGARADLKNPRAIGALGRLYHANHYYREAASCYALAARLEPRNPRWAYLEADALLAGGGSEAAPKLLARTVELEPGYTASHLRLGDLAFKTGAFEPAGRHYRAALAAGSDSAHGFFGLARIAVEERRTNEAEDLLEQVLHLDPEFSSAVRLLANLRTEQGRAAEAESLLTLARGQGRFVPPRDPWVDSLLFVCYDTDFLLAMADRSIKQSEMKTAAELFRRAMELDPENAQIHQLLAKKLYRAGRPAEAIASLRRAIELDPQSADARVELGYYLGSQGATAEAEKVLREAIALAPENERAHSELGKLFDQTGRRQEAIRSLEHALQINPRSTEGLVQLGFIHYQAGERARAVQLWRSALEVDGRFAKAHFGLGIESRDRGDTTAADARFAQAVRINPDYTGAHQELARSARRRKAAEVARNHYQEVLRIEKGNTEARSYVVLSLAREGRGREAVAALQAAPGGPAADANLRLALGQELIEREAALAVPLLESAVEASASFAPGHELLGRAYLQTGNAAAAIAALTTAIQLGRRDPATYMNLARAQVRAQQAKAAEESFRKALALEPGWTEAANNLAWLLATTTDPAVRDGNEAVRIAKEAAARAEGPDPILLDTLAAAYATAGKFEQAITTVERALALARQRGDAALEQEISARRALYQSGKPFLQS
ncbi:MAG: tetratricopeptide repeat protein [Candidatus Eisenbacteria bacterium]|nr:tetratricopeptide repeat protein [Candidatus Eisenbacteria bacterium]MCC7143935.1 tetratricopeptide repeat protein [Candidatus Eisenbacteria bacterium]